MVKNRTFFGECQQSTCNLLRSHRSSTAFVSQACRARLDGIERSVIQLERATLSRLNYFSVSVFERANNVIYHRQMIFHIHDSLCHFSSFVVHCFWCFFEAKLLPIQHTTGLQGAAKYPPPRIFLQFSQQSLGLSNRNFTKYLIILCAHNGVIIFQWAYDVL